MYILIIIFMCMIIIISRIHSAFVAGINYQLNSATVEWFEQGETKGKEIDFNIIESLNPNVSITKPETIIIEDTPVKTNEVLKNTGLQLQRNPTRQSVQQTLLASTRTNGSIRTKQNRFTNFLNSGHILEPEKNEKEKISSIPHSKSTASVPQNSRRTNVVKEVEKLKKNREERRQRQAEEKAEKEAFLQMAPGNPHWELLNMIQEYRRSLDIKPLTENDVVEDHLITVCVRKRPLNKRESTKKEVDVITIPSKNQLIVHEPKNKVDLTKYLENQLFRFDYAFDETCTNEVVYKYTAQPLVKTVFEGGFATCFAYGQTGSGKTHTMGGDFVGKNQDCQRGIYAMAASDVFRFANSPKYRHLNLVVSASFFEIYSGKVFDLLANKAKLRILEDGKQQVQVVGLTEKVVVSSDEVLKLIQKGNQARTSGQTSANTNSSRSHAIFQIILRPNNALHKVHGKFSLIDLAGNERGADTSSADRQTRMEGAEINKSLLALKECIRALGRKGSHLPFRVSKLTQVLRDSFVGPNSRTCMIAMISPGVSSCEHSLNTLRYADRVKELGAGDLATAQEEDGADNVKSSDGDLLQLRSLNENDMTPEMLKFHEVISELQIAEDNMLDNHKQTIDQLYTAADKAEKILKMTDEVDYDTEAYCKSWNNILDSLEASIKQAKNVIKDYELKLAVEEQLSRKTKQK
ncbi:kinesin-like protein Klp10A isoform X3 [Agrilus planipennis]|uniref:Kinesin-like protein n=1 Tax=Agrilus planipennis TaxID=224129 RepID=A0A7F5R5T0_AGRPL|nr:kinesin-like protein Klp10A isoform X3 [Agrilus planipennis]